MWLGSCCVGNMGRNFVLWGNDSEITVMFKQVGASGAGEQKVLMGWTLGFDSCLVFSGSAPVL